MNIAPPKEAHPDLGRTLNHMLLWLAPPVHAPGDFRPAALPSRVVEDRAKAHTTAAAM
jgi:hypothetical protein